MARVSRVTCLVMLALAMLAAPVCGNLGKAETTLVPGVTVQLLVSQDEEPVMRMVVTASAQEVTVVGNGFEVCRDYSDLLSSLVGLTSAAEAATLEETIAELAAEHCAFVPLINNTVNATAAIAVCAATGGGASQLPLCVVSGILYAISANVTVEGTAEVARVSVLVRPDEPTGSGTTLQVVSSEPTAMTWTWTTPARAGNASVPFSPLPFDASLELWSTSVSGDASAPPATSSTLRVGATTTFDVLVRSVALTAGATQTRFLNLQPYKLYAARLLPRGSRPLDPVLGSTDSSLPVAAPSNVVLLRPGNTSVILSFDDANPKTSPNVAALVEVTDLLTNEVDVRQVPLNIGFALVCAEGGPAQWLVGAVGLLPNADYSLRIAVVSPKGPGTVFSPRLRLQTLRGVGGDMLPPTAQQLPGDSIRVNVSWSPQERPGSPVLEKYEVILRHQTTLEDKPVVVAPAARTWVVVSGEDLQDYTVAVRAVTDIGAGALSPNVPTVVASASSPNVSSSLGANEIAGLIVGTILLMLLVVIALWRFVFRPARQRFKYGSGAMEIKRSSLQVHYRRPLGHGAHATVFFGSLRKTSGSDTSTVAVKHLDPDSQLEVNNFLQEAATMMKCSEPGHPNVLKLLGSCTQAPPMLIVTEHARHGDVKGFLNKQHERQQQLTGPWCIKFAADIAAGMEYLHVKDIIHRDLAARNCLVFNGGIIKISDYGMAKDLGSAQYYTRQNNPNIPIRHTAPEVLHSMKFSKEGDVWSFGVTVWEIITNAGIPYGCFGDTDDVVLAVLQGLRLKFPQGAPGLLVNIAELCFEFQRPSFKEIRKILAAQTEELDFGSCCVSFHDAAWDVRDVDIFAEAEQGTMGRHDSEYFSLAGMRRSLGSGTNKSEGYSVVLLAPAASSEPGIMSDGILSDGYQENHAVTSLV